METALLGVDSVRHDIDPIGTLSMSGMTLRMFSQVDRLSPPL